MQKKIYLVALLTLYHFSALSTEVQKITPEDDTISNLHLSDKSIKNSHIKNNEITNVKIKEASIAIKKLKGENLSDLSIPAWSNADGKWTPLEFSDLDPSKGSVNQIIIGEGFQNEGSSITNTGTINLDIGEGPTKIIQYNDEANLNNKNLTIINSKNTNEGEINFISDDIDFSLKSVGNKLIFTDNTDGNLLFGVQANGNVKAEGNLITNGKIYINDKYYVPTTAPLAGQILGTDSSGNLKWLSIEEIEDAETSVNLIGNGKSIQASEETTANWKVSVDSSTTTPVTNTDGDSWFTRFQINDEGLVINNDQIEASDMPFQISASKFSTGLISDDEFNTLNNIDDSKGTLESRLLAIESNDLSQLVPLIGSEIQGKVQVTNNQDLIITDGSDLQLKSGATLILQADTTFNGQNFIENSDLAVSSVESNEIENFTLRNFDFSPTAEIEFKKMQTLNSSEMVISNSSKLLTTSGFNSASATGLGLTDGTNKIYNSLEEIPSGATQNTIFGIQAGHGHGPGDGNTILGFQAGNSLDSGSRNVIIGVNSDTGGDLNNQLIISNGTNEIVTGDFSTNEVTIMNLETDKLNAGDIKHLEFLTLDKITAPIEPRLSGLEEKIIDVKIISDLRIGFSITEAESPECDAANGYSLTTGGCSCPEQIEASINSTAVRWFCKCSPKIGLTVIRAFAVCAKF